MNKVIISLLFGLEIISSFNIVAFSNNNNLQNIYKKTIKHNKFNLFVVDNEDYLNKMIKVIDFLLIDNNCFIENNNLFKNLDDYGVPPGRIDINIKMDYINTQNLNDFYKFYYDEDMSDNLLCKYKDINKYSLSQTNLTNISTDKSSFENNLDNFIKN